MAANDSSFLIQKQVRENTEDLERCINELKRWEEGVKQKEKRLSGNDEEPPLKKQQLTRDDVEYVKSAFNSGLRQMKAAKWSNAVTSFSRAIKKYNKNPMFFLKRAKCYLKLNQAEEAESDCTECLKLDPKILKAKYIRAQSREMMGNLRGACLDLQDILILDPPNQTAKIEMDRLKPLYKESLREEGYDLFANEEEEGECDDNKNGIIEVLAGNGNPLDEAELEERVRFANKAKEEGNIFVKEKNYDEAKEAYSRAIAYNPNESIYYANRALCHLKTKNEYKASLDCGMALKLNPRYVKAYMRRSAARQVLGDLWGARQDVKQVLVLEPNNTQAKEHLELLNQLIEQKYKDGTSPGKKIKTENKKMELDKSNNEIKCNTSQNEKLSKSSKNNDDSGDEMPPSYCKDNNKIEVDSKNDFIYVYPIEKPLSKRSKKPLMRIPIKCEQMELPKAEESQNIDNRYLKELPDWMLDLSKIKKEVEETRTQNSCDNKVLIKPFSQCIITNEIKSEKMSSSTVKSNDLDQDFVETFSIDKKPHTRSKAPLKRVPITFINE